MPTGTIDSHIEPINRAPGPMNSTAARMTKDDVSFDSVVCAPARAFTTVRENDPVTLDMSEKRTEWGQHRKQSAGGGGHCFGRTSDWKSSVRRADDVRHTKGNHLLVGINEVPAGLPGHCSQGNVIKAKADGQAAAHTHTNLCSQWQWTPCSL